MSLARSLSLSVAVVVAASGCGADAVVAPEAAPLVQDNSAPSDSEEAPAGDLFLPAATDTPDRLQLIASGDLDGPTVQPAGSLDDGATWDGNLTMVLSLDADLGWTQPLVDVGFAVVVDQIASDEWRYLVSYSEASLTEVVDNTAVENPELAQELMESYSKLSIVSTVDAFGITSDTQIIGVERMPAIYQLDIKDFADQMSDLATPVPGGELGVGAIWIDQSTSTLFGEPVETTYTYEIVAIDGPTYTLDFSFSAAPVSGEGQATSSASGSIVADVNKPIPLSSNFTVTAVLPLGAIDPPDPVATIEVTLEGS